MTSLNRRLLLRAGFAVTAMTAAGMPLPALANENVPNMVGQVFWFQ